MIRSDHSAPSVVIDPSIYRALKIGVVQARFNSDITGTLSEGAIARLQELGIGIERIVSIQVPGAFEVPLAAQKLLRAERCDAVIAVACVIRGDTDHYDYVCSAIQQGCMRVALDEARAVIFCVLTTDTLQQAKERTGGKHGHKGREAADAAVEMAAMTHMTLAQREQGLR